MTNEQLRELNKSRRIFQIGFVTHDLEKSMRAWIDNLGIGPWAVLTFTEAEMKNLKVDEKPVTEPFKFRIGATRVGDIQIELIQPVYGPTFIAKFIAEKGAGFHHIKEQVADDKLPAVLAALREKGIGVRQTGEFEADVHYHLNTAPKLDFVYELGNCASVDVPPEMISIYPPEG